MQTLIFGLLASLTSFFRTVGNGAFFVIGLGLTYLFANFGPNATTFVVPAEAFPTKVRATAHGISAASGKLGAVLGSTLLLNLWYSYCTSSKDGSGMPNCGVAGAVTAESDRGIVAVMWVCAGVSAAGLLVSLLLTREAMGLSLEDVDLTGEGDSLSGALHRLREIPQWGFARAFSDATPF
jgi:PHS family inorganic phosphate transporter-like MFS transporter